jgi:hypothetical protein
MEVARLEMNYTTHADEVWIKTCAWCVPLVAASTASLLLALLFALLVWAYLRARRARQLRFASSLPPAWEAAATEWSAGASYSSLSVALAAGASAEGPRRRPRTPRCAGEGRAVFSPQRAQQRLGGASEVDEGRLRDALAQLESARGAPPPAETPPPPPLPPAK